MDTDKRKDLTRISRISRIHTNPTQNLYFNNRNSHSRHVYFSREVFAFLLMTVFLVPLQSVLATSTARSSCINNLRMIQGAVALWGLEHHLPTTSAYSLSDTNILSCLGRGVTLPLCPADGSYSAGRTIADEPSCSVHGTASQMIKEDEHRKRRSEYFEEVLVSVLVFAALLGLVFAVLGFARRGKARSFV